MLQTFAMMSSIEASTASSVSTAGGSSSSDPAIAELLRGMRQVQVELRVVRQGQEEITQQLSLQAHRDTFRKKSN